MAVHVLSWTNKSNEKTILAHFRQRKYKDWRVPHVRRSGDSGLLVYGRGSGAIQLEAFRGGCGRRIEPIF